MNKDELINTLKNLSDEELVQVMSEVLPVREPYKSEPLVNSSKMFLGIYAQDNEEAYIKIVAYPKNGELGPDWGFCQDAESEIKAVEYTSNCKECTSPFTGNAVYLT
jgi:hypothetical protein